jgi:hypothetical protein
MSGPDLLTSKDDLTPRTTAAATDGWSGDAIAVPVEFARGLERASIRLHALLCRTLDDYRGSLPDPERVEVSSDTRHRLMHIKDRMREADALLDGARIPVVETSASQSGLPAESAPLPGSNPGTRAPDDVEAKDEKGRPFFGDERWREKLERGPEHPKTGSALPDRIMKEPQ